MNAHDASAFRYTASLSEQLAADAAELARLFRYRKTVDRCTFQMECGLCRTPQNVRVPEGLTPVKVVCYRCGHTTSLELSWP
ncbi:MAG TPA: hypothetical protein VMO88_16600 [Acidimicrobiales bacterium]|jgi:hypothetical protein|nr:hypothetical protein [Acidimicrobiales bacterium]